MNGAFSLGCLKHAMSHLLGFNKP